MWTAAHLLAVNLRLLQIATKLPKFFLVRGSFVVLEIGLGLVSDSRAFLLGLVSVSDWVDFLNETS